MLSKTPVSVLSQVAKAGSIAIDTSAVIRLFRGDGIAVSCFNGAGLIYMPVTVLGELYCGLRRCNNPQKEQARVEDLRGRCPLLQIDEQTADCYSTIHSNLEAEGNMIPINDIWIGAVAIRHGIPLLAKDGHFQRIRGLEIIEL